MAIPSPLRHSRSLAKKARMPSVPPNDAPNGASCGALPSGTPPVTETPEPQDHWACERWQCHAEATEFVFGVGRPKRFCLKHFLIFHQQQLARWNRQKVRAAIRAAKNKK